MDRRSFAAALAAAPLAIREMFVAEAKTCVYAVDGFCNSGKVCCGGLVCVDGRCKEENVFYIVVPAPTPFKQSCRNGQTALTCCKQAIRRVCRGVGGHRACRRQGFRQCRKKFGG